MVVVNRLAARESNSVCIFAYPPRVVIAMHNSGQDSDSIIRVPSLHFVTAMHSSGQDDDSIISVSSLRTGIAME